MPPLSPELLFQQHVADFLVREHRYTTLEQTDIDPDHGWHADGLWAFLQATQPDALNKLADDYGADARREVFRALAEALRTHPLWWLIRHGLDVRGTRLHLYYPTPRSAAEATNSQYEQNRFAVRPHYYFGPTNAEVDLVIFLNGLPIVAIELKHEAGAQRWNVHDAVEQFVQRDHSVPVFRLPFLYLAAHTSEVKMATDPRREPNFRWFNTGLRNEPITPPAADGSSEYPVEYLYREVLSPAHLVEALSFLLVRVPERPATEDKPYRPAFTLFPRYHQQRMVRKVADAALQRFIETGEPGGKYLVEHSAGSGKTLSICWLAERLHSLHHPTTGAKLVDMTVILTDRKSLDKNIRDDLENFEHLKDVVGLAKSANDLQKYLRERRSIIVTTQQKFTWILKEIEKDPVLRGRRVAYLIDEAHRSQEGQMGLAIRLPFRQKDEPDAADEADEGEKAETDIAAAIREHDHNQLFVAFTATPSQTTVDLFGPPIDRYTEAEAIQEGYIVDVAGSVLSYKTLYNLHCAIAEPERRTYPAGIVQKALQTVAFQDEELIQYKAEVMLRLFDERVKGLIGGKAKAMIVATSRVAGLRYFEILREKLRERGADYKVLYAFSDFTHPETNKEVREHDINGLDNGELIEDRFDGDSYRLMVVANKFQTGFDQPMLAGMFLDKPISGRNAVQTVSRLNRQHEGKKDVIVVDFTNNADAIFKAFNLYRKGSPYEPGEPDPDAASKLYDEIVGAEVFEQKDADEMVRRLEGPDDAGRQQLVAELKKVFEERLADGQPRRDFVNLLTRYVQRYYFLANFFTFPDGLARFARFAEYVGPQLIKQGTVSELMERIRATGVVRGQVEDLGEKRLEPRQPGTPGSPKPRAGGGSPPQVTVADMIERLRLKFQISDDEALVIRDVLDEKIGDAVIGADVTAHRTDQIYLDGPLKTQVNVGIQTAYVSRDRIDEIGDPKYFEPGGIFDFMAYSVIQHHLFVSTDRRV
ncbi:DEAD/DEAH box helicase family protein [uncultured Luteimonas sp.]|uniref:DEAD/DEAH box helicase family protein n=1 Tax=uncultured Luteimonas sp. TaxID=453144 RepID=UPI0026211AEC|nr:DEAD/DEAH box helicase family protein [uncultured Luteimonas sp.]